MNLERKRSEQIYVIAKVDGLSLEKIEGQMVKQKHSHRNKAAECELSP